MPPNELTTAWCRRDFLKPSAAAAFGLGVPHLFARDNPEVLRGGEFQFVGLPKAGDRMRINLIAKSHPQSSK